MIVYWLFNRIHISLLRMKNQSEHIAVFGCNLSLIIFLSPISELVNTKFSLLSFSFVTFSFIGVNIFDYVNYKDLLTPMQVFLTKFAR